MAYEMVMPYHLHMPSYFLETFTEYPCIGYRNRTADVLLTLLHKKRSNALLQPFVNLKSNTMKNTHANIHTFLLSANLKKR